MTPLHRRLLSRFTFALAVACVLVTTTLPAQQFGTLSPAEVQRRKDLEAELQSIAIVERKVMMPMRDGIRLATDIYRPKDAKGPVPIVFSKTPYNFNYWDVRNRVPADMSTPLAWVKRGYAYVVQNERG
ncbi:MAG: CocE/NonD family hydrolase, partial [Vicinamibacterales bacterium]